MIFLFTRAKTRKTSLKGNPEFARITGIENGETNSNYY
jgi:hypothetical protein